MKKLHMFLWWILESWFRSNYNNCHRSYYSGISPESIGHRIVHFMDISLLRYAMKMKSYLHGFFVIFLWVSQFKFNRLSRAKAHLNRSRIGLKKRSYQNSTGRTLENITWIRM